MHRFRHAAVPLAALAMAATHPARAGAQCAGCLPRTTGEGVSVSHVRCEQEGDAYCEWEIRWQGGSGVGG